MTTYPIVDKQTGIPFAFEIENVYASPRSVAALLRGIKGVSDVRLRRRFRDAADVHVEFLYRERSHIVWEPYGDSSRYWIGPSDPEADRSDIRQVEQAFRDYRPVFWRRIVGPLLSHGWVTGSSERGQRSVDER